MRTHCPLVNGRAIVGVRQCVRSREREQSQVDARAILTCRTKKKPCGCKAFKKTWWGEEDRKPLAKPFAT